MKLRSMLVILVIWVGSLLGVGLWAQEKLRVVPAPAGSVVGPVISGDNIGFEPMDGVKAAKGKVVGRIVVRINGQWLPIESPVTVVR